MLTFGSTGDKINFVVNTSFGLASATPGWALSVDGTVGFVNLTTATAAGSVCRTNATGLITFNSGDACTTSVRAFKHDIQDLNISGLDYVNALKSVSFIFNEDYIDDGRIRYGFIADDTVLVDPYLGTYNGTTLSGVDDRAILSVVIKAIQELDLNLGNIASTTATTTPQSEFFATSFFSNLFTKLITWFGDVTNGIQKFFAKEVHTDTLCVSDTSGETCITKSQLDALLAGTVASGSGNSGGGNGGGNGGGTSSTENPASGETSGETSGTDTTDPVVTVTGNNPATIQTGDTYSDMGATVTDTDASGATNNNLGITYNVDGLDAEFIIIDTSIAGTHTIIYSATDGAGNTGTATRTVIVEDPNVTVEPVPESEPSPKPSPTLEPEPEVVVTP